VVSMGNEGYKYWSSEIYLCMDVLVLWNRIQVYSYERKGSIQYLAPWINFPNACVLVCERE